MNYQLLSLSYCCYYHYDSRKLIFENPVGWLGAMIERNYIKELFKDIPAAIFLSIEIYGFCIMIR